jgi:gliding motility-associated lipoprotein GldB
MKKLSTLIFIGLLFANCKKEKTLLQKIKNLNIKTELVTFHKKFYEADEEALKQLKTKHPFLFPNTTSDQVWLSKINNLEERELFRMTDSIYGDMAEEKENLNLLFQHIHYYNSNFTPPKTFSLITGLDYENNVIYADSLLFISFDMYLGKNAEPYASFPPYIKNNYTKKHLLVDVAKKILQKKFIYKNGRSFLETMLYHGKEVFLLSTVLPNYKIQELMGYEDEKYQWAVENEAEIWSYFIRKNLLYSTDQKLNPRFIDEAPFSKFYLDSDRLTPGRLGVWIGYKIVQSFADNNDVSLQELLALNAESLFRNSRYKPLK